MSAPLPRLRADAGVVPVRHEGRDLYLVHDASGLVPGQVAVSPAVLFILSHCDGKNGVEEIRRLFRTETGQDLSAEELDGIVRELDNALLLQTPAFTAHRAERLAAFAASIFRPAACAGTVYPEEPPALRESLSSWLAAASPPEPEWKSLPRALVVPHIDYRRGAPVYARAYRALQPLPPPETVVVLGTSHRPTATRFVLTKKDFATPLGRVRTAEALVDRLASALPADPYQDEFTHCQESSVELQLPFLQHLWGDAFALLPVLCGSLREEIASKRDPNLLAEVSAFARALGELREEYGDRLLCIASADLSHVGPYFGDGKPLTDARLQEAEAADRAYLAACLSGDAAAAFRTLAASNNATEICSPACLHMLLASGNGAQGELLGYEQAVAKEGGQAVGFAACAYFAAGM